MRKNITKQGLDPEGKKRQYYEQFCTHKCGDLDEGNYFLEKYKSLKFT